MKSTYEKRELEKLHDLERQYVSDGFNVVVQPAPSKLPSFLRKLDFTPDLIAKSKRENHVVVVSSSASVKKLERYAAVASAVEAQPRWKFLLVMTNPRDGSTQLHEPTVKNTNQLRDALANVRELSGFSKASGNKHDYAALLAAWSVFEASLRHEYVRSGEVIRATSSQSIVRDAVMLGLLKRTDGAFLEHIAQKRNAIAHGNITIPIGKHDLERLVKLTSKLVESGDRTSNSQER